MITARDSRLIKQIAERAVALYERLGFGTILPEYIAAELYIVHDEVVPLRLQEMLDADDSNFAHDVGGIHRHLSIGKHTKLTDCFVPRFAVQP